MLITKLQVLLIKYIPKGAWVLCSFFTRINKRLHRYPIRLPLIKKRSFIVDLRHSVFLYLLRKGHIDDKANEEILLSIIHIDDKIFDIGANIGYMSYLFNENCNKVHAFEPSETCVDLFKINLINSDNIVIENVAVGSENGKVDFYENKHLLISRTSNIHENKVHIQSNRSLFTKKVVNQIKLDTYCNLNNVFPTIVKIDVEGFENEVFLGMKNILINNKPILYFEAMTIRRKQSQINLLNNLTNGIYNFYDIRKGKLIKSDQDNNPGYIFAIPHWAKDRFKLSYQL